MRVPINILSKNKSILGMLHISECQNSLPIVIIVCIGKNGNRADVHQIITKLGDTCKKNNINVCTFDYNGTGVSDGDFFNSTIKSRTKNLADVINFIKGCFNNKLHIYLLGFCDGAKVVLNYIGNVNEPAIKGLIFWNPFLNTISNDTEKGKYFFDKKTDSGIHPKYKRIYFRFSGLFMSSNMLRDIINDTSIKYLSSFEKALFIFSCKDEISKNVYNYVNSNKEHSWTIKKIQNVGHLFERISSEKEVIISTIEWIKKNE
jgi:alpha/beta superfamily hydrolase